MKIGFLYVFVHYGENEEQYFGPCVPLALCGDECEWIVQWIFHQKETPSEVSKDAQGLLCCISGAHTHCPASEKRFSGCKALCGMVSHTLTPVPVAAYHASLALLSLWGHFFNSKCIILALMLWFFIKHSPYCQF